jgi:hypothetical protein
MAKLYADENFPSPVVERLRELGHDVLTIFEAGKANRRYPDELVLLDASRRNCAVLTMNRKHFWKLHQSSPDHGGIILCTYDPNFADQAGRIHDAIKDRTSLAGQLIRVNRPSSPKRSHSSAHEE